MSATLRAVKLAKLVSQRLEIGLDCRGEFIADIPWCMIKESQLSGTMSSFCGYGPTVESACQSMLANLAGIIVCDAPGSKRKELAVFGV